MGSVEERERQQRERLCFVVLDYLIGVFSGTPKAPRYFPRLTLLVFIKSRLCPSTDLSTPLEAWQPFRTTGNHQRKKKSNIPSN